MQLTIFVSIKANSTPKVLYFAITQQHHDNI